jgi:hypothetical protein
MAIPQTYDFQNHTKGDTFKGVSFTILVNTVPLVITGAKIEMQLKLEKKAGATAVKTFSTVDNTILITDGAAGKFQIARQIIDIPAKQYFHDIEITLQSGEKDTYISGKWMIMQDVTNG